VNTSAKGAAYEREAEEKADEFVPAMKIDKPVAAFKFSGKQTEAFKAGLLAVQAAFGMVLLVGASATVPGILNALSEFGTIVSVVTNTSITLLDGITNAQTGSTIYDNAVEIYAHLNLEGVKRLRVALLSGTSGQSYMVVGDAVTFDSF